MSEHNERVIKALRAMAIDARSLAQQIVMKDAADQIARLEDEVDTLTELLADALPKLVERLRLLSQVAQLQAELARRESWEWDCPVCGTHVTSKAVGR